MIPKLIITIVSFLAAVLTWFEKFYRKEEKAKVYDWIVFFVLLIGGGATAYEIWEDNDNEKQAIQDLNKRNELMQLKIQKGIDSGITVNNQFLAEAFNRQNIDIDSLRQVVNAIKADTVKVKFADMPELVPDVDFAFENGIKFIKKAGNQYNFTVTLTSREAKAKSVEVKLYPVALTSANEYIKIENPLLFGNSYTDISKDVGITNSLNLVISGDDSIKVLFVVAKGKYWNVTKTRSYPLYSVRILQLSTGIYAPLRPDGYPAVWQYLEPR